MYAEAAMAAMQLIDQRAMIKATVKAQRKMDAANRSMQASAHNLKRMVQSINNQRIMRAADKNLASSSSNIKRMQTAFAAGNVNKQIEGREMLGAFTVNVASVGALGASSEIIERTARLSAAREENLIKENQAASQYDASLQRSGILSNAAQAMAMDQWSVGTAVEMPQGGRGADFTQLLSAGMSAFLGDQLSGLGNMFSSKAGTATSVGSAGQSFANFKFMERSYGLM